MRTAASILVVLFAILSVAQELPRANSSVDTYGVLASKLPSLPGKIVAASTAKSGRDPLLVVVHSEVSGLQLFAFRNGGESKLQQVWKSGRLIDVFESEEDTSFVTTELFGQEVFQLDGCRPRACSLYFGTLLYIPSMNVAIYGVRTPAGIQISSSAPELASFNQWLVEHLTERSSAQ